jgi:hypothetical protein
VVWYPTNEVHHRRRPCSEAEVSRHFETGHAASMTISEPNPDVRPTGEEPAEFVEPPEDEPRDEREADVDPRARPSQSPPAPS